jgi:hypothetical protein
MLIWMKHWKALIPKMKPLPRHPKRLKLDPGASRYVVLVRVTQIPYEHHGLTLETRNYSRINAFGRGINVVEAYHS